MVELDFRSQKFQVKNNITARDALKKIGIEPESVLVMVNGKLATDDVILKDGDQVKLVAVVSGGQTECVLPNGCGRTKSLAVGSDSTLGSR